MNEGSTPQGIRSWSRKFMFNHISDAFERYGASPAGNANFANGGL
jgi:hypothetical protein